jgi:AraC-like DNA-binding protein
MGMQLLGEGRPPRRVFFRHTRPAHEGAYTRIFGREVLFSQPRHEIVFKREVLDFQQLHRDDDVRDLLRRRAEELLARQGSDDHLVARATAAARAALACGSVDPAAVARRLGMTSRSLQRRLRERGCSLNAVLEAARRDIACQALKDRESSIKDIAFRLGFSEPSAFHRAFKRWTSMTPAEYRALA